MSGSQTLRFRQLDASPDGLQELARFYRRAYVPEFPDPDERESLANMQRYLRLKAQGWYGRNNYHIVLAEIDGAPVGGSVFDYFAEPNAGMIEFLFIGSTHRLMGLGKLLLEETGRLLELDARAAGVGRLPAIVAEMNDPFRRGAEPDSLDPFERCALWGKWGFRKVDFPYVQPALSRRQRPVEDLVLILRTADRAESKVDASWVLSVVCEYMRWAMRIDRPTRNLQYQAMQRFAGANRRIPLVPLQSYVGRDPEKPLHVRELDAGDPSLEELRWLLAEAIPQSGRVASLRDFRQALSGASGRRTRYHLWSLSESASVPAEGVASFFTLRPAGFGGYIVLGGSLKGKGLLRGLMARIEEAMIRDAVGANGWFIECGEESLAPFICAGFREVRIDYRPPPVGRRTKAGGRSKGAERLHLLYKPFGRPCDQQPARRFVLDALVAILQRVYRVEAPRAHRSYLRARASLEKT